MEGKDVLTSILQEQSDYINNTIGVPITGITEEAMKVPKNSDTKSIKQVLMGTHLVESVERTYATKSNGKWILIVKKNKQTQVMTYLKENMIKLYRNHNGQSRLINMNTEKEKLQEKKRTTYGVLTYAAALTSRYRKQTNQQTKTIPNTVEQKQKNSTNKNNRRTFPSNKTDSDDTVMVEDKSELSPNHDTNEQVGSKCDDTTPETQASESSTGYIKNNAGKTNEPLALEHRINEQIKRMEKLHEILEEKQQKLKSAQEEQTRHIKESIKDTVETETTQKMQLISEKVATSVSGQLISVIKTLMAKTNPPTNEKATKDISDSSNINEDVDMDQREDHSTKGPTYKRSTSTTNDMLKALSTIKTNRKNKSSTHDKQTELENRET